MADNMSHASLLQAMELKFDYMSARSILADILEKSEVGAKAEYEKAEIERIAAALRVVYPKAERAIDGMLSFFNPPPPEVVAAEPPAPPVEVVPVVEPPVEPVAPPVQVPPPAEAPVEVVPEKVEEAKVEKKGKKKKDEVKEEAVAKEEIKAEEPPAEK